MNLSAQIQAAETRLNRIEETYHKTCKRYGINNNENHRNPVPADCDRNHSMDDVSRVPMEEQVLHTGASQPTEGGR